MELVGRGQAAILPPERLFPDSTALLLTVPNYASLRKSWQQSSPGGFFNDPAVRPFHEKFVSHWEEDIVEPLRHSMHFSVEEFLEKVEGQVCVALVRADAPGSRGSGLAWILSLDGGTNTADLASQLNRFKKNWREAGKPMRVERLRQVDVAIIEVVSDDIPESVKKYFPANPELHELGEPEKPAEKGAHEIALAQSGSTFLISSSLNAMEGLLSRLDGGKAPSLADSSGYETARLALFRNAPVYLWINASLVADWWAHNGGAPKKSNLPDPFSLVKVDRVFSASGLSALQGLALTCNFRNDGIFLEALGLAPEARRTGLLKAIAGQTRDLSVPDFVPADALNFRRWRLDGQQTYGIVERALREAAPQLLNGLNFVLNTANASGGDQSPGFDVRKNLIDNLGDDLIVFSKRRPGSATNAAPSLVLMGSPAPARLALSLQKIFIFLNAAPPEEHEYLGRKVYTLPLPAFPLPFFESPGSGPGRTLNYAMTSKYVALSTDAGMVEEFLRSPESDNRALRDRAGLPEAIQMVSAPGMAQLRYRNEREIARGKFASGKTRASTNSPAFNPLVASLGIPTPPSRVTDWMEYGLLPPFDEVSKYFGFSVYALGATSEALWGRAFFPRPVSTRP